MTAALLAAYARIPTGAIIEPSKVSGRAQIIAVVVTVLLLALVLELVRRRRLVERYALLWMLAASFLVVLAVWNGALNFIANTVGIQSPPNALFLLGLGVIFGLLLNFSIAFSRLSEQTKILAQEVARLDREQRRVRRGGPLVAAVNGDGDHPAGVAARPAADDPRA